jgi:hypothetical protein
VKPVVIMLLVLSSLGYATGIPVVLEREADVARVITAARHEVLVTAPSLRSRAVANALREVVVQGGVRVLILCDAKRVAEPSSFVPALSLLKGRSSQLEVRVLRGVNQAHLIVDGTRVVFGALVAAPWTHGLEPTRLVMDVAEARTQARAFFVQWRRALPWLLTIRPPRFTSGGSP